MCHDISAVYAYCAHQAVPAFDSDDLRIFVEMLASGEKAVAVLYRGYRFDLSVAEASTLELVARTNLPR